MSDKKFAVNEENKIHEGEDADTIQRCSHDETNRFSIISNALIRDESISPECRWLIIYLLSNKENWKINISQIINHVKKHMGRDKVYAIVDEAIEAGYIKREEIQRKNKNGGSLKGFRYLLSENPKFKKFYRHPENQDTGDQHPGNPHIKNTIPKKDYPEEELSPPIPPLSEDSANADAAKAAEVEGSKSPPKPKRTRIPSDFSPKVREIGTLMINALMKHNPDYRPPTNLSPFLTQVNLLLNQDKHEADRILELLEWALADNVERGDFKGWSSVIYAKNPAETLRKHFAKIAMQMNAKPKKVERKFAPSSNDERSLEKMKEWSKGAL